MKKILGRIRRFLILFLILVLVGCTLPFGQTVYEPEIIAPTGEPGSPTEEPVIVTEESVTPTEEPVAFSEPEAGTPMLWTDRSYVVYVPAGEFGMGKNETETSDHNPLHTITLGGFWIHQAEVTNSMYAICVNLGICSPPTIETGKPNWFSDPEYANAPVVGVNWNQAGTYCEWIDARLPTEAEWEKAARGTNGDPYPWGEEAPTCSLLNFEDCLPSPAPETIRSYPLGASPYMLADMAGNVFEWVFDWYADDYYSSSPISNPTGPTTGEKRVVRGSSYLTPAEELNIALRSSLEPEKQRSDLGFRCVLNGEATTTETPNTPYCELLSFDLIIPIKQWPEQQPGVPPNFKVQAYCIQRLEEPQFGTASIWLDPTVDPNFVTFSSPQGSLNCFPDIIDPLKFNCSGFALQPGNMVTITVCNESVPVPAAVAPICPIFYHFDMTTNLCTYGVPQLVQCMPPDMVIPGYGCLPPPQDGECPAGSYVATYLNNPVCIPAGGPKCQGQFCPATCPPGLVFNEGNYCCDYPVDMQPTCPPGYSYNATTKTCQPATQIQPACTTITTLVPLCPTRVPRVGCWIRSMASTGAPSKTCVYPCPVGVANEGPCNP
jgi:formylglycine-generating enzyme required for sulfatase activity